MLFVSLHVTRNGFSATMKNFATCRVEMKDKWGSTARYHRVVANPIQSSIKFFYNVSRRRPSQVCRIKFESFLIWKFIKRLSRFIAHKNVVKFVVVFTAGREWFFFSKISLNSRKGLHFSFYGGNIAGERGEWAGLMCMRWSGWTKIFWFYHNNIPSLEVVCCFHADFQRCLLPG